MTQRCKQLRAVIVVFAVLAVGVALAPHFSILDSVRAADTAAATPSATQTPANQADEKAIRATAEDFLRAFNAGDAKAVGALWAADAEYTDESGKSYQGRAAIEKEYVDFFKEHPGATMTVRIESVRFLGPDIAVEKGIAQVKFPSADARLGSRYTVVHARRDGKWIMVVGRDAPYVPGSNEDYLKDLEWVIGDWAIDAKDRPLRLHFEWMAQRNFIKNTYILTKDGKETLTGGQIIGWNPKLGRIVSWHFDAQGGFGDDVWTKDGAKWVIEATGVFRNGSESAAVNIVTPIDANSFTWQSVKRTLDGVSLPDVKPVKIVRVHPAK
ncbi:MAG: SgcJ/EcaC family oxidoreductase [Thermoguttaceae bacterium]